MLYFAMLKHAMLDFLVLWYTALRYTYMRAIPGMFRTCRPNEEQSEPRLQVAYSTEPTLVQQEVWLEGLCPNAGPPES